MNIRTVGKLLIALGVGVVLYALNMPVSTGYSGIVNIHLMNQKQNTLILGGLLFISGIILFATFKIKQTKQEEDLDLKAREELREKAVVKMEIGRIGAKKFFDWFFDIQADRVNPMRDRVILRAITGVYVGFCFSLVLSDLFDWGFLFGFPMILWLAFRPRAASLVVYKINLANLILMLGGIVVLKIQDMVNVYSYNKNSIIGLAALIPVSAVLAFYARRRLK